MSRKGTDAAVLIGGALLLGSVAGCVTFPKPQPEVQQLTGSPAEQPPGATVELTEDSAQQMPLDAIEEFLRLTEQYALDEPASPDSVLHGESVPESPAAVNTLPSGGAPPPLRTTSPALSTQAFANAQVDLTAPAVAQAAPAPPAIPVVRSVSVRAPSPPTVTQTPDPVNATVNEPLQAQGEVQRELYESVLAQLEEEADQDDFEGQWRLRLTQLALGRDEEARLLPAELTGTERSILQGLVSVSLAAGRAARDPVHAAEDALARLDELRTTLMELADPMVTAVAFCRRVLTFGVYEEMETTDFAAGQTIHTIVYCEISNFTSELTEDGRYRTLLGTRLEALTADGRSVWEHEEPEIEDLCRRRRTDFFLAQRIALPPTLPPGNYILKVLVEDHLAGKAHEASHPFSIITPSTIARGGG